MPLRVRLVGLIKTRFNLGSTDIKRFSTTGLGLVITDIWATGGHIRDSTARAAQDR